MKFIISQIPLISIFINLVFSEVDDNIKDLNNKNKNLINKGNGILNTDKGLDELMSLKTKALNEIERINKMIYSVNDAENLIQKLEEEVEKLNVIIKERLEEDPNLNS